MDPFNEFINRIGQWTNEGSGWIIDKVEGLYINTANYEPLSGSSYIPLPKELNNSMKALINIKKKTLNVLCGFILDLLILKIKMQKE